MRNFFRLAAIIGSLPNTIANGQTADAVPLMADLNFIVTQVNANAAPLANTALTNASNSFTQPQGGVSAQTVAQFVIAQDIITGGYQTLTSTLGTNLITARSTQIVPSSAQAGQAVFLIPSQTNTGPVSLNRDSLGSFAVMQLGSGLRGGELQAGVPVRLFLDGSNYNIVGPAPFSFKVSTNVVSINGGTGAMVVIKQTANSIGNGFRSIRSDTAGFVDLYMGGDGNGYFQNNGSNTAAMVLGSTGSIAVGGTPPGSGAGVSFPPTQAPSTDANTLDDYEEGTWTPSVGGNATYTEQSGTYTKVGRLIFVQGLLTINAIGTGSASTISGLPFANITNGQSVISVTESASLATSVVSLFGRIGTGLSTILFFSRTVASASESSGNPIFANGASIRFSGCYQTT